jgi:hypothetical protein
MAEEDAAVGGLSGPAEAGEGQASGLVVYQFPSQNCRWFVQGACATT